MERLTEEGRRRPINSKAQNSESVAKTPKEPTLDENPDEMNSYLLRFKSYAPAQRWKRDQWAINLSAFLKNKVLDVYVLMPLKRVLDYDMLMAALVKRLTEEGSSKGIKMYTRFW